MTSITSKQSRLRIKVLYLCHCSRVFPSEHLLCRHTLIEHNEEVLALEGYLTKTSAVHRILRSQPSQAPTLGHKDHPIALDEKEENQQEQVQEQDDSASMERMEPELALELEEQRAESPQQEEEAQQKEPSKESVEAEQQPPKTNSIIKKRKRPGRRPNFLIKVLQNADPAMQLCSWLLGRFMNSPWCKQLPGLDFRQLMARANQSKLCYQLCRFIAGWPIAQQGFNQQSFRAARDRLIVLSLLPLGEEAFMKFRGIEKIEEGEHTTFFNFFFLEFVPALLHQKRMQRWVATSKASVLLQKGAILAEITAFLKWWNHEVPALAVFNHPAQDFTPLLLADTLLPLHNLPKAQMEEEQQADND